MKTSSYESMLGPTGQIEVEDEDYLIIRVPGREGSPVGGRTIDLNLRTNTIRIYSNRQWKVHPMDSNSRNTGIEVLEGS